MRKLLHGPHSEKKNYNNSTLAPSDSLPLVHRFRKTRKQDSAFGTNETRETKYQTSNPKMSSPFHLLDETGGKGTRRNLRNVALGNASDYDSMNTTGTTETAVSDGSAHSRNVSTSQSSWILLQRGRMILLILAVVYGSLNISMRLVFARPNPPTASASSTIQGWFAVLCFLPLLWRNKYINNSSSNKGCLGMFDFSDKGHVSHIADSNRNNSRSFFRFAVELAFLNFGTQALINMSLVAVQGARASFLVQMSVVFTPLVSVIFGKQKVSKRVWIACFLALTGLFVLSHSEAQQIDNAEDNEDNSLPSFTFTWGDWCCLLAALCWSLYIYRLSAWGEFFDETMTQFVKNIVLALLYTLWMLFSLVVRIHNSDEESASTDDGVSLWKGWKSDPIAWLILFYSALGPCTLADVFQQKAQSSVPAAESNVILSMEPVFTTLLGFVLLGETPSVKELCGGCLIMIASVVASCSPQPSTLPLPPESG